MILMFNLALLLQGRVFFSFFLSLLKNCVPESCPCRVFIFWFGLASHPTNSYLKQRKECEICRTGRIKLFFFLLWVFLFFKFLMLPGSSVDQPLFFFSSPGLNFSTFDEHCFIFFEFEIETLILNWNSTGH